MCRSNHFLHNNFWFTNLLMWFSVAAPTVLGGQELAVSPVQHLWRNPELCTPGSLPSCGTTPHQCPALFRAPRPLRSSLHTRSSKTPRCLPTQLPILSLSWRRLKGGWRRRGGGLLCCRPNRGMLICQNLFLFWLSNVFNIRFGFS